MNHFPSSTPRVAFAIAAVAMTLVTFGLLIVMPATIESGNQGARTQAAATVVTLTATELVIIPTRIDLFRVREMKLASAPVDNVRLKRKQAD